MPRRAKVYLDPPDAGANEEPSSPTPLLRGEATTPETRNKKRPRDKHAKAEEHKNEEREIASPPARRSGAADGRSSHFDAVESFHNDTSRDDISVGGETPGTPPHSPTPLLKGALSSDAHGGNITGKAAEVDPDDKWASFGTPQDSVILFCIRVPWSAQFVALGHYLLFLTVFLCYVYVGRDSSQPFWVNDSLVQRFVRAPFQSRAAFMDVATPADWWSWARNVLLPTLYPETAYNGNPLPDEQKLFIAGGGAFRVGLARLRQLRVQPLTCAVPERFQDSLTRCYAPYTVDDEDRSDWAAANATWAPKRELDMTNYIGSQSKTLYPGSGYVTLLPDNYTGAATVLDALYNATYLDFQTRVVFVELTLYNQNVAQFSTCQIAAEVSAAGRIVPSYYISTYPMGSWLSSLRPTTTGTGDEMHFGFTCALWILVAYRTAIIALDVRRTGLKAYTVQFWNLMDVLNVAIFWVQFVLAGVVWAGMRRLEDDFDHRDVFVNMFPVRLVSEYEQSIMAFNGVITLFLFFEYVTFHPGLNQFSDTLGRSSSDMMMICVIIGIVICGFAVSFMLVFGHAVADYRSFNEAMATLFSTVLGNLEIDPLRAVAPIMGPFLFVSFIILMVFVVLSMMFAVVAAAYETVIEQAEGRPKSDDPIVRDLKRVGVAAMAAAQRMPGLRALLIPPRPPPPPPPIAAEGPVGGGAGDADDGASPSSAANEVGARRRRGDSGGGGGVGEADSSLSSVLPPPPPALPPGELFMQELQALEQHQRQLVCKLEGIILSARDAQRVHRERLRRERVRIDDGDDAT